MSEILEEDEIMTAAEVAAMLKVAPRTVAETWLRGRNNPTFPRPFYLGGKTKRWYRKDIVAWANSKRAQ